MMRCLSSVVVAAAVLLAGCESVSRVVLPEKRPRGEAIGPKATFTSEPDIRVRVAAGVSSREVSGPEMIVVRPATTDPGLKAQQAKSPVTVTSGPGGVKVVDGGGKVIEFPFSTDVEILPLGVGSQGGMAGGSQSLKVGAVRYPGFVVIRPQWNGNPSVFEVVISMPVESYLPGVLTHELFKDWPRQVFECQAVAARTYALHERARSRAEGRGYDVEDSTQDQVYGGATSATLPNEAARATRGQVLAYEGRLIRAYYSSACGGRPNSAKMVWPTGKGYEFNLLEPVQGKKRQHYCQGSRFYRWEVTRSDDDVSRRLRAWGKAFKHEVENLTRLRSVEVEERNDAERPVRYRVMDDRGGSYVLTGEELRNGLNQGVAGLAGITEKTRVNSGDLEVEVWADTVRIRGRGWGHGVGMCQWCAKGMADSGLDWRTMISQFYPSAEVVRAYDTGR